MMQFSINNPIQFINYSANTVDIIRLQAILKFRKGLKYKFIALFAKSSGFIGYSANN